MDNIKESKEYQLAKDWERAVNDYGFNPKRFAAAIPEMHPTLQQAFTDWSRSVSWSWRTRHATTMTATVHRTRKRSASWNTSRFTGNTSH